MYKIVKDYLLESVFVTIVTLFLGGIFLIAFEKSFREKDNQIENIEDISYKQCLYIGLFQSIAIIPGISRSAATIIGGMYLGLKRKTIVEFSFLLAVPTMLAASGLDLLKNYKSFSGSQIDVLAVGFIVAFIVAMFSIKFLLNYIRKHDFIAFGVYRIIIALAFLFFS
jgi:undecaprenyl-diphosphatase